MSAATVVSRLQPPKISGGIIALAVFLGILALVLSAFVWIGVPLLAWLLVFPALGLAGWPLIGATAVFTAVWWLILGIATKAKR